LSNLGLIKLSWSLIWPSLLILLGLWTLVNTLASYSGVSRTLSVPLEGVESARVTVNYGAGRLFISSDAAPGTLLSGDFDGGVEEQINRESGLAKIRLDSSQIITPFSGWGERREWSFGLVNNVPVSLKISAGAMESRIDLSKVRVTDLDLETGASDVTLTLPAQAGLTRVDIEGGATSIKVTIPEGVAARIKAGGGLYSADVNTTRFPKSGDVYLSPDFEKAENKVDIRAELGAGALKIY
jgi:hypothetical protein